ncbi:hypothetical protein EDB81DRAFT_34465 [Dactylonectria macrodidyma]|uniref:Uncharacterized protein n=1 Tax=Dactylonectria macrodidyma TaxID=307937 RepID=A0A9P9FUN3_9HYPO|nr:hypothetical protein EDB81DRAFT_34465 [Dactylonectria macrodidyma]
MVPHNLSPITVPGGQVVASKVEKHDGNLLIENNRAMGTLRLVEQLWTGRHNLVAIANHHLGSEGRPFATVKPRNTWKEGEFKVSLMVERAGKSGDVENDAFVQVFEPISNGEEANPGAVEERVRVDIASWVLFKKLAPEIPTAQIIGFGLPDGTQFTHISQLPQEYADDYVRRCREFSIGDEDIFATPFVPHECGNKLPVGLAYIIFKPVMRPGRLLSTVWNTDPTFDQISNLWESFASIISSLTKKTYSKIGSFLFNNNGTATLSNRPIYNAIVQLERDGVSPVMSRDRTFTSSTDFVEAVLKIQDDRVVKHPHAILNELHCREQMGFRTLLHGLIRHLISLEFCKGTFVAQIHDFDVDHFMVDEDWNIVCVLDIGSIAILPIEMVHEPEWLTGVLVDEDEDSVPADVTRPAFIEVIGDRQKELNVRIHGPTGPILLADVMTEAWESKAYWLLITLTTSFNMSDIAGPELLPTFSDLSDEEIEEVDVALWGPDPASVVQRAMHNREHYIRQIVAKFGPGGEFGPDRDIVDLGPGGADDNFI